MRIRIKNRIFIGNLFFIILVFSILGFVNIVFSDRFYILEKRENLNHAYKEILKGDLNIKEIEDITSTIIVSTNYINDIDYLNEDIFTKLIWKKIKLNKFWITKETLDMLNKGSVNKIYTQDILKYKFYVKILKKNDNIFLIGTTLSDPKEIIKIINKFIILMIIASIILNLILININMRKITKPLSTIKVLSKDIGLLNFRTESMKSYKEIEDLSKEVNKMSVSLKKAHEEINSQNSMLKDLLSNVSHEIKTPLSIIKAYTEGIEDGLDDGTYIDTIHDEINKIDSLIERLLLWFKIDKEEKDIKTIDLLKIIKETLKKYKIILKDMDFKFESFGESFNVNINEEHLLIVLNNLITNSIKYSKDKIIDISIFKNHKGVTFKISNGSNPFYEDIDKIFIPFYVKEKSRDKNFSGTGLGLPIVKEILNKYNLDFSATYESGKFIFVIDFI